jgi:hypothetical protein
VTFASENERLKPALQIQDVKVSLMKEEEEKQEDIDDQHNLEEDIRTKEELEKKI